MMGFFSLNPILWTNIFGGRHRRIYWYNIDTYVYQKWYQVIELTETINLSTNKAIFREKNCFRG